jgi:putative nucleotidyltransferase-like protein
MGLRSAEAELVLACARLELAPEGRARILQILDAGVDWALAIEIADGNAVVPLLARHLLALPDGILPKELLVELWGRHESAARRKRAMARELAQMLELFDANGIEAIPYKGPALAESVYGDVALREFGDLDILLRPRDVLRAKALLQARGYVPEYPLEPAVEAAFLRSSAQYHLVMVHEERGMVELHWKTDPDFQVERIDDERWWAGLQRAPFGEGAVRCFSPEETLLILCVHGSKHYWNALGWLVDVAEWLRQHPRMDWGWIGQAAQRLGCTRRVDLGLALAQRLLGAHLPQQVRLRIAGEAPLDPLADRIEAALFDPRFEGLRPLEAMRFNMKLYERNRDRLRYCVNTILAPSLVEWTRWPLPRALFFLYPPMRLMRLSRKYLLR